jgi:hypothetical protein
MKISEIRMRDPFIVELTDGYALFGTTDTNLWGGPATGFDCYTSKDFENWNGPVEAFRPPADFWADTQFWAPEIHQVDGAFYMFATFATAAPKPKVRGVAILRSEEVTGPYLPHSDGPVTPVEMPCLDGTLFTDASGQHWLVYSRGAEGSPTAPGISDGEMYARRLSQDLREAVGEPVLLFRSSEAPWSRPLWFPPGVEPPEELGLAKDPLFTDGAFLLDAPDGSLLMLWSAFGEEGYAIGMAHSASGDILGPWTQQAEPIWARNGGHGMVLRSKSLGDLLVFHAPNDTPNERVVVAPIEIGNNTANLKP